MGTLIREPICYGCKHQWTHNRCAAFPRGIPAQIRSGENDHRNPVPGDNGIQFEPIKDSA